jgi:hypothetical protein
MTHSSKWLMKRRAGAIFCGFLLLYPTASTMAQTPEAAPVTVLSSDQLDDLVAPIALYPDSLLGQVLAASTYPLEIVEAQQWLGQNRALDGVRLLDAARQQNWDASVQALVAFPNVLALLNRDIRWTTDLGNAFLSQQADVMNAVQRLRSRARDDGKLASTPEQSVTVATEGDQSAIEIQPANPQIIYVPTYNPTYVWGPPAGGAYPALGYPNTGFGFGLNSIGFNPGVLIGALFSGLMSFGGWGWGLSWLAHALFLNNLFFGHFGFGGLGGFGGGLGARSVWAHNPGHRLGVPYPNRMVASRFASGRANYSARSFEGGSRRAAPYNASYARGGSSYAGGGGRSYERYNRGTVDGSRYNSPAQGYRGSSNSAPQRGTQTFASSYRRASTAARAPAARYSSPNMSSRGSAPRVSNSSRSSHFKAPHVSSHSGGHSSGHSSGGHSGKHR